MYKFKIINYQGNTGEKATLFILFTLRIHDDVDHIHPSHPMTTSTTFTPNDVVYFVSQVDVKVDEKDLKIQFFRSSGAGMHTHCQRRTTAFEPKDRK